ncbi:hypothetical protein THIOSC15_30004 [uncultured Thiomicrorhabdus sp.]
MSKHVTIEALKFKETEPMAHSTFEIRLNGKAYKSFNELSDAMLFSALLFSALLLSSYTPKTPLLKGV